MKQYLDQLRDIRENGFDGAERTGTGKRTLPGTMMKFWPAKEFPLLTTKFTSLKTVALELFKFLEGDTNNENFKALGCNIWNHWALKQEDFILSIEEREKLLSDPEKRAEYEVAVSEFVSFDSNQENALSAYKHGLLDSFAIPAKSSTAYSIGDLGPIYSALWRRLPVYDGEYMFFDVRQGPSDGPVEIPESAVQEDLQSEYTGDLDIWQENSGESFRIIKDLGTMAGKNTIYQIQFDSTKTVAQVSRNSIRAKHVLNAYAPKLFNVGCVGNPTRMVNRKVYDLWYNMMSRCYNERNPAYEFYGARGVRVSPRWKCFENFIADISKLPYYEQWACEPNKYCLDKDYFGSKCYDVSTCVFLTHRMNKNISKSQRPMKVTMPDGVVKIFGMFKDLVDFLGVSDETVRSAIAGRYENSGLKGIVIEDIEIPNGKVFRKQIVKDQISELLHGLKTNPSSRRHIVSGWIPTLLPDEKKSHRENIFDGKPVLPPCHTMFQFIAETISFEQRLERLKQTGVAVNIEGLLTPDVSQFDLDAIEETMRIREIPKYDLHCILYQRSGDVPIGVPYNIASYSLFLMMVAQCVGMGVGSFTHMGGDMHIYHNQFEGVDEQLTRTPGKPPVVLLNPNQRDLFAFSWKDIKVLNYEHQGKIHFPVAV